MNINYTLSPNQIVWFVLWSLFICIVRLEFFSARYSKGTSNAPLNTFTFFAIFGCVVFLGYFIQMVINHDFLRALFIIVFEGLLSFLFHQIIVKINAFRVANREELQHRMRQEVRRDIYNQLFDTGIKWVSIFGIVYMIAIACAYFLLKLYI